MFKRRLGPDPHAVGVETPALSGCPAVLEMDSGDFAVIGEDITGSAKDKLPKTVSWSADETIIRIPRKTLILAKGDIPDSP